MNFVIFYLKSIENIRQQSIAVLIHCNSYFMYNQLINSQYRQFFSAVTIKASDVYEEIYPKLQCNK